MSNSRNKKKLSIGKLAIPFILIVFIFSIFKVGKTLASTDSFKITDVQVSSKSATSEVKNLTYEKCKVTKDIEFHKVGDSITYSIKVKNNDDKNYVVRAISDDNKNNYITYEYNSCEGTKLNAGEETTFEITEKYSQENSSMSHRNQSFTVNFTFTLEDEKGNVVEEEIKVNPQTGDNIGPYVATAIASLILLIVLSRRRNVVNASSNNVAKSTRVARSSTVRNNKTTNKQKGKHCGKGFKFLSLILAIVILFPTISKAADNNSLVITFDNNIYLKDKLLVQYEADGKIKEKVVKYNELLGEIEEPTKSGYEFEEWVLEDGSTFDPETPITDDIKITAKFKTVTYTISYDLKDGSLEEGKTNPEEYTVESEDIVLNKPTKESYTFAGWTGTELNGIVENVTIAKGSTGNREYIANWTPSDYTITYNLNGGTATGNPSTYTIESDDINLNKPTKFGYTFTGWTGTELTDKTEEVLIAKGSKGNREYTANWTPTVYTITYQGLTQEEEIALNNPTEYTIETQAITLNNPQDRRDSDNDLTERFVGWRENVSVSTNITIPAELGNKIYEAVWVEVDPDVYTVTYNLNGGTVATENRTSFTKYDTFTLNNPSKRGYTFSGWTGSNGTTPETTVTVPTGIRENLSYEANWTEDRYTITYNLDGGTAENPREYTVNSSDITLNRPTKTGYTFTGWTGTDLTEKTMVVTIPTGSIGNREYTANWQANTYSVIFDRNTGSGSMANQTMTYDVEANLNTNEFTKTGYTFAGWNTKADGQGTHYRDGDAVSNLASEQGAEVTLYAEWTPNTYTIVFNKNDDAATGTMANQTMTYDTAANLTPNAFEKTNYTFVRWNTQADGQGVIYRDGQEVTNLATEEGATVNLYAEWEGNQYRVIFDKNNENATGMMEPQEFNYDVTQELNSNTYTLNHYKFMGWNTKADGTGTHYDNEQAVINLSTGEDVTLYAEWKELSSTLQTGASINAILREINEDATTFTRYTGTLDFDNIDGERDIALATSNFPVWTWADGDTIYWWSEAEKPNMNSNSAEMFYSTKFTSVDLSGFNTTTATTLRSMFTRSYAENINFGDGDFTNVSDMSGMFEATKVTTLDLSGIKTSTTLNTVSRMFAESSNLTNITFSEDFDTSGVTLFSEMFRGAGSLANIDGVEDFDTSSAIKMNGMFWNNKVTSLDLTGWDVSNVTTIEHLFRGCSKLETLDVSNWNVSNVTNMSDVFGTPVVNTLDLSHWTNSKVKTMDYMFQGGKYTELDLSGFDTSNVTNMGYMFNETGKIETVYVSEDFVINTDQAMFINNKCMVGGAGTANPAGGAWRTSYGCIDDPDNGKTGYFTLKNARYIRYNGNGADNAEPYGTMTSHYLTNTGSLKANAYTRDGYTFVGWNTEADGSGTSYTDKQLMSDIVESKTPLTLYAQWEKNRTKLYNVANVGDYVEYKPTTTSYTPNSNSNVTGTIYPNMTTSWRVLSKNSDGTIDLISTNTVGTLTFGKSGYGVENNTYSCLDNTFEGISNSYINSNYAGSVRIPSASDFNTIKNNGLASSQNYILNKKDYESRSTTGDHEGGATWDYYIYYANGSTIEKFRIWYKYAGTGGQSSTGYSTTLGIRPIVRLKANLYTNDGTGTSGNSYKITN